MRCAPSATTSTGPVPTVAAGRPGGPPRRPGDAPMAAGVRDNPDQHRFELPVGEALAAAYYRVDGNRVVLTHTEVPQELSGQGIASRLAEGAFALIRASGRKAVTRCSFMAQWASRHPEVAD